ncbi:DUF2283 domain-containing protein [Candidatus Saganbacteria bacterium]|nr:DUF2283 domain-containing protein [Candidatus Saganbacteria bacterium]
MEKIRIMYDEVGNTLDIWLKKPQKTINEETGKEIILKKDKKGNLLGFEILNYLPIGGKISKIPVEFVLSSK